MSVIYGDIMTNYYLTNTSPSGAGFERFHTLWDYYEKDNSNTLSGMKKLIQRSHFYLVRQYIFLTTKLLML